MKGTSWGMDLRFPVQLLPGKQLEKPDMRESTRKETYSSISATEV